MFVIGLTGGIACGKSSVEKYFAAHNITIIDTDIIAREVVEPKSHAWQEIKDYFGDDILNPDNSLNRALLREKVFADASARKWLENLLHPLIRVQTAQRIENATSPYCIVVIPLLVETLPNPLLDRILVVDCSPELQLQRLMVRDNIDKALAKKMIHSQISRQQRLSAADDIIENHGDLSLLKEAVDNMHQEYLQLANSTSA